MGTGAPVPVLVPVPVLLLVSVRVVKGEEGVPVVR